MKYGGGSIILWEGFSKPGTVIGYKIVDFRFEIPKGG